MDWWRRFDAAVRRHRLVAALATGAAVGGVRYARYGLRAGLLGLGGTAAFAYLAMRWFSRDPGR